MEKKRFPFLNDQEREIVFDFEKGKLQENSVVELMFQFSENFRNASTPDIRIKSRGKLLDLAGLYEIIPVERFEAARNHALSLTLLELRIEDGEEPFSALMRCGEIPFDMLVNFPNFKEFFNVKNPAGSTYSQLLISKQASIGGVFVVIKGQIDDELQDQVTASSEPLTRSILLNPYITGSNTEVRDFASMAFDLVMQLEFLSIFYNQKNTLNRIPVQAAMRFAGLRFVLDVFACLVKRAVDAGHVEIKITPEEFVLTNKGGEEGFELCRYLNYLISSLTITTINYLTEILEFKEAELEIGKVLLEHSIGFDPRRVKFKIL